MPLQKENGFSLVELMIAMLLLTFGLLSAITLETACFQGNSTAARIDEATALAQVKLEEWLAGPDPTTLANIPEPSLTATGAVNGPFARTATITAGPTADSKWVRVNVTWTGGLGNRQVELRDLWTGGK